MEHEDALYTEATQKLAYIEKVKQELCTLLDWLTDVRASRMYVRAQDFDYACACIREAIDDMYYEEMRYAKNIQASHT